MAYTLTGDDAIAFEQITRDMRAWAGQLNKLLADGIALRVAYDQTLVPLANGIALQGADVIPNTATLPGSDPDWTYSDVITTASYMDVDATAITTTGTDWDETAKLAHYVRAAGPLS